MNNRRRKFRSAATPFFIAYCVLMIWLLFGQRIGFYSGGKYLDTLIGNVNIIPFATIGHQISLIAAGSARARHCIINLGGNVIMFIPLGLLTPLIWKKLRSFRRFILTVFVTIIAVETVQLVTLLGSMDIDDLILNLAGASIGFALSALMLKIKKP